MSRVRIIGVVLAGLAVLWLAGGTFGEDETGVSGQTAQGAQTCVYVGVKKCAFCHVRLDDSLRTWAITKHANALAVLSTPEARKHSKNPEQDPKCLKCHVTGMETDRMHGADIVDGDFVGVQCEMCHGPGQLYRAEMARALPKEHELDKQECTRRGLVIPNEQTCRKCHNEECPVFTGFDFEKAVKMIKHGEKQAKCEYIGQEKCTFCHVRVDESASTWVIMKHINAFSILKTKLAQKFSKDPVHDEKCLECHSTGLNVPGGYTMDDPAGKKLEGVQCEMCHGWGYSYVEVMARAKVLDVYDVRDDCFRHGLVIPDEKVCLRCHNERCPVFTGFDFEASLKQLRHGQAFKKH